MAEAIYLSLEGHQELLDPDRFTKAIRYFLGILRDLDAAISQNPKGTVSWGIHALSKGSPAVVAFRGQPLLVDRDYTPDIESECVEGLNRITTTGERSRRYSDATVFKIVRLARLQIGPPSERLDSIRVSLDGEKAVLSPSTLTNAQSLVEPRYESIGSLVGSLDSITVHSGNEFRVWNEVTGFAVRCRFSSEMMSQVKDLLGRRVVVHGSIRSNERGQPTSVEVKDFETYPEESELPAIEEMSGLVDDFTDGMPLKDYLEAIRDG